MQIRLIGSGVKLNFGPNLCPSYRLLQYKTEKDAARKSPAHVCVQSRIQDIVYLAGWR